MNFTKIIRKLVITGVLAGALCASSVQADDNVNEELKLLRDQLMALSQRLDELESSNRELQQSNEALVAANEANTSAVEEAGNMVASLEESASRSSWTESLGWSGDFRYRYENIGVENSDGRNRSRIRARAALKADIYEDMEVAIGIASGSDDPVSSNQTLGGGGSTKDLGLDLAYFKWTGLENTTITGGKFKNMLKPVGKNSMLWDGDWRPEGTAISFDNGLFFANGLGTWLESDSRNGTEFAWIADVGMHFRPTENVKLRAGISYHEFNIAGSKSFFDDGDFFGNSFDPVSGTYLYNYHGLGAFGEVGFALFDLPTLVYAEYVQNQDAPIYDTGYIAGFKMGSAKAPGTWDAGIAYQDLEADAAVGLLVDSDFGGGGTDGRGFIFKGSYAIKNGFSFTGTYFINKIDENLGTEKDFDRLMLDLNFKF